MSDELCEVANDTVRLCNTYWDGQVLLVMIITER